MRIYVNMIICSQVFLEFHNIHVNVNLSCVSRCITLNYYYIYELMIKMKTEKKKWEDIFQYKILKYFSLRNSCAFVLILSR